MSFLLNIAFSALSTPCIAMPRDNASSIEQDRMAMIQYACMHDSRIYVKSCIEDLGKKHTYDYTITLLYSLSLLGESNALPAFDNLINTSKDDNIVTYARVTRARLVAENTAMNIKKPSDKALTKVQTFFRELKFSSTEINDAVKSFQTELDAREELSKTQSDLPWMKYNIKVVAMDQLADIIYQSNTYNEYINLQDVKNINFDKLPSTRFKMQIAKLNKKDRISALIEHLYNIGVNDPTDKYAIQLLINYGKPARDAASIKIKTKVEYLISQGLAANVQYKSSGISSLHKVLQFTGGDEYYSQSGEIMKQYTNNNVTIYPTLYVLAY